MDIFFDRRLWHEVNPGCFQAPIDFRPSIKEPESSSDLKSPLKIVIFKKGQFYYALLSQFPRMISKIPNEAMQKNKVCYNAFIRLPIALYET
jgi:hypothetical protein